MGVNKALEPPGAWLVRAISAIWYDFLLLHYIGIVAIIKEVFTRPPKADMKKIEKRTGQVAVLTGGPRGLALGLIKRLVQMDYTIIMGVRSTKDGEKRLEEFAKSNKELSFDKIKFLEMDLMSLKSIRQFAKDVSMETTRIDLLLCNAAIMAAPYELTLDGYESQFQVNYLSNFLLTHLLLDKMKKTAVVKGAPCQIIYTSSVVYSYGTFLKNEMAHPSVYTPYKFYFPSKLYPVMSMLYLQRKLRNENAHAQVHLYAVHPGLIPTDLWFSGGGSFGYWVGTKIQKFVRSVDNAADTILWPILSNKNKNRGGLYMESGCSIPISEGARDRKKQAILYNQSLKLAGIS